LRRASEGSTATKILEIKLPSSIHVSIDESNIKGQDDYEHQYHSLSFMH